MINDQIFNQWKKTGYDTSHPLYNNIIKDLYGLVRAYATKLGQASGRFSEIDDVTQKVIIKISNDIKKWNPKKLSFWKFINMVIYKKVISGYRITPYIARERTCMYTLGNHDEDTDFLDSIHKDKEYPPSYEEIETKEVLMRFRKLEKEIIPYLSDTQLLAYSIYVLKICGGTHNEIKCESLTYKSLDNAIRCTRKILRAYMQGKPMRYSRSYCDGSKFDPRVKELIYDDTLPTPYSYTKEPEEEDYIKISARVRRVKGDPRYMPKDKVVV